MFVARIPTQEGTMATFVTLVSFTDQGARTIKDSPNRAEAFQAAAAKLGVQVKSMLWTTGQYDLVVTVEGPEEAVMASLVSTAAMGNIRTQTLRAYTATEVKKIIAMLP
jgi:uncharacterized protein with GYD domain